MRNILTLPKLIIALIAIVFGGFVLYGRTTAQPVRDFIGETHRFDSSVPTQMDIPLKEPGKPEFGTGNVSPEQIQGWIELLRAEHDGSRVFTNAIANLERLLKRVSSTQPMLLPNYPNPFNPETWIPYQLATDAEVRVSIYTAEGKLVRTLALGYQEAGVYQSRSRAAYWDGRNDVGERVASGVYFYTLTAGDFHATRKMLVIK
ncbi:MAG: T9SS type A sorting domain-containing protein [Candidatus Poribacteria bacterium]|nr:T9SS type A sorting domain-containing protein [Candidatus Poribacteria bacterium]MYK19104.1 T9SS type A sorting domain-containing protein [Candidatus Poribacteria bacterium]